MHKEIRTEFFGEYVLLLVAGIVFATDWALRGSNLGGERISIPAHSLVQLVLAVFPVA